MSQFTVYTIPGSPYARAVMATLEEKHVPWRLIPLAAGAHKRPEHLARNPFGRMPAIEHDGFALYEVQAIVRYIDRLIPEPEMTPRDPKFAARMDQAMNINDWYLFQNCGAVIGFQRVVGPKLLGITPDEAVIAEVMPRAETVFAELSRLLSEQAYFAGDDVSLADMMIGPQLDFLAMTPEWEQLVVDRKNLVTWLERIRRRPSFQATTWESLSKKAAA